jgi:hypothetical protein
LTQFDSSAFRGHHRAILSPLFGCPVDEHRNLMNTDDRFNFFFVRWSRIAYILNRIPAIIRQHIGPLLPLSLVRTPRNNIPPPAAELLGSVQASDGHWRRIVLASWLLIKDKKRSEIVGRIIMQARQPADDGQSRLRQVLEGSVLPDAINLSRRKDGPWTMTSDELRQLAMKLPANTSVTSLDLSHQNMGPDMLLELAGPLALLTCLRQLNLAGAYVQPYGLGLKASMLVGFLLGRLLFFFLSSAHVYRSTRCGSEWRVYPMIFKLCIQCLPIASRAHNCTNLLLFHRIPIERTPAGSSHMLAGNGITRTCDAAPALASLLSNLTALCTLDISGAYAPVMFKSSPRVIFNSSPYPHPDNDIVGFSDQPGHYRQDDEVAAAVQPFALSLALLRDLESLNVSGVRAKVVNDIDECSSLVRCSRAALAPQSQIRMLCWIVTI